MYQGNPEQHFGPTTYSQHGDDIVIMSIFRLLGIDKPSYLDLGAHHPFEISNTALMYSRGSRGVNVEANPNMMDAFREHRPDDKNICIGVGLEEGRKEFFMWGPECGRNSFSTDEVASVAKEIDREVQKVITLPLKTLNQIVEESCAGVFPHFLNCDIEGLDYDVLKSADFTKSSPILICVETRHHDSRRMTQMMMLQNYWPQCRVGENILYIRRDYLPVLGEKMGL